MMHNLLPHFQSVGSNLYSRNMLSMHGGNLSMREGKQLCITRTGSSLGFLTDSDLVQTGIDKDDENTRLASSELPIHRAIYQQTSYAAIVHAHPLHATVISSLSENIVPLDEAGILFIPEIPVIGFNVKPAPGKFAGEIAAALKSHAVVMVYRHGSFARGKTLEEAFVMTELLEISCQMLYMERCIRE